MRHSLALLVLLFGFHHAGGQPPIAATPGYQHDRFVTAPRDHVKEFQAYLASFDTNDDDDGDGMPEARGVPEFVAYELRIGVPQGTPNEPSRWRVVPDLPPGTPSPTDDSYKDSGYSRGHLCMRDHAHRLGPVANYHTFNVMNACPQKQAFNAGHWLGLEKMAGAWADAYGSVWIVCGPVFKDRKASKWIGDAGEVPVAIPDGFYKIIVKDSADPKRPDVLAFYYEHLETLDDSSADVDHSPFLKSVDWIEEKTGLDFLSALEDDVEASVERDPAPALWPTILIAQAPAKKGPTAAPKVGKKGPGIEPAEEPVSDLERQKLALDVEKLKLKIAKLKEGSGDGWSTWLIALIGALAGIAGTLIPVLLAYYTRLGALDQSVHDKRLETYPEFVQATEPLAVYFPAGDKTPLTPSDCGAMGRAMSAWYFGRGGLLLSSESRKAYFRLAKALTRASRATELSVPTFPADAEVISSDKLDAYRAELAAHLDQVDTWVFGPAPAGEQSPATRFRDYVFLQRLASLLRTELSEDLRSRKRPASDDKAP